MKPERKWMMMATPSQFMIHAKYATGISALPWKRCVCLALSKKDAMRNIRTFAAQRWLVT